MTQQHITPPTEMLQRWMDLPLIEEERLAVAYRSGADAELEACCAFAEDQSWGLVNGPHVANVIRAARRPKPKSLKEEALQALNDAVKMADDAPPEGICSDQADIIRRALEQLDG
jgi:hypothetical protein